MTLARAIREFQISAIRLAIRLVDAFAAARSRLAGYYTPRVESESLRFPTARLAVLSRLAVVVCHPSSRSSDGAPRAPSRSRSTRCNRACSALAAASSAATFASVSSLSAASAASAARTRRPSPPRPRRAPPPPPPRRPTRPRAQRRSPSPRTRRLSARLSFAPRPRSPCARISSNLRVAFPRNPTPAIPAIPTIPTTPRARESRNASPRPRTRTARGGARTRGARQRRLVRPRRAPAPRGYIRSFVDDASDELAPKRVIQQRLAVREMALGQQLRGPLPHEHVQDGPRVLGHHARLGHSEKIPPDRCHFSGTNAKARTPEPRKCSNARTTPSISIQPPRWRRRASTEGPEPCFAAHHARVTSRASTYTPYSYYRTRRGGAGGGASARESIRRGARRRERRYRDEGWCDGDSRDGCGAGEARGGARRGTGFDAGPPTSRALARALERR